MKVLNIVRHAKSSWDTGGLSYFERPLKNRGVKNSKELATALDEAGASIDIVVSSSAVRAISTANLITENLRTSQPEVISRDDLYLSSVEKWIDVIQNASEEHNEIMIVGHQPTLSMLTNTLVNEPLEHVITCSCSRLEFDTDSW